MLALSYRGYTAETDFDWLELCWIGHVVNTDDAIGFLGTTVEEAERDFRETVDAYLAARGEVGVAA